MTSTSDAGHYLPRPKRMTKAKAERLVDALAAIAECEDGPTGPEFDDVRAAVEPWMEG